jgi:SAM-dependent methyltransferase
MESGKQFEVTGADLANIRPTAYVSRNLAELKQVVFLPCTPAEALPLADACIDAVVSQYGVEYSDLGRSVPEAVRLLAKGGRLRFAVHAAEGAVVRDTKKAIADADFLIGLDLPTLAAHSSTALDAFNAGLKAIADRAPASTDQAMLASVHQTLCDTYDHRRGELLATAEHLQAEITAHRDRQMALLDAALSAVQAKELAGTLEGLGMTAVALGEQRDGDDLIGHVIEATKV